MVLGTCLALGLERRQRDVARPGRFLVGLTLPYGEPGGLVLAPRDPPRRRDSR